MNRLATAILLCLALPAVQAATPFDETRPLNPDAEVALDNVAGRIIVTTWDKAEIHITGRRGEGTEGLLIEGDARNLKVRIQYPENGGGWFGWGRDAQESELRVTLPAGVSLDVDSVSAEVDVRGLSGRELRIDSVSGDVMLEATAGEVHVESVSGDQRLKLTSNEVHAESVSGEIDVDGAIGDRVQLEAVSGALRLDSTGAARQVSAGVVSGEISLRTALQPGGRISAESLSGDLEVILPKGSSAKLEASSFTGTIRSEAGTVETEEHGPGSSLSTTLGSGDGRIELETFSGDLTVRSE